MTSTPPHDSTNPEDPAEGIAGESRDASVGAGQVTSRGELAGDLRPSATVYEPGSEPRPYDTASGRPNGASGAGFGSGPETRAEFLPGASVSAASTRPRSGPGWLTVSAIAIAAGVVGGLGGAGVVSLASRDGAATRVIDAPSAQNISINDSANVGALTAVSAKGLQSVVTIRVSSSGSSATGSGVVLSSDGYIVTNNHVVTVGGTTNSGTVRVTLPGGRIVAAEVIGTDPYADLAVVKVNETGLVPVEFADSAKLNVGAPVIAIGAPLQLENTVTQGIISALHRGIEIESTAVPSNGTDNANGNGNGSSNGQQGPFSFFNFGNGSAQRSAGTISIPVIQTDAAINEGNSGGALLDGQGRLIGVNVAILSNGGSSNSSAGNIGLGFAIESNLVKRITGELIANRKATHGLLGVAVSSAGTDTTASSEGAAVGTVSNGGPASKAGLKVGDVILAVNGVAVSGKVDLTAQIRFYAAGDSITLTVLRGSDKLQLPVTLGALG